MKLNSEIFKYIAKTFLVSSAIIILSFSSIIFIGDLVEYNKKLAAYDINSFGLILFF